MRSNSPLQISMVDLNWLNILQLGAGQNGMLNSFVDLNQSISQPQNPPGMIGDIILVSDQNDGISGPVELFKKAHNLIPSLRVQISGRFISQEDGWIIDQCPRYRYSLSLTS